MKRELTAIDIEQIILMAWGEKAWDAFARSCQRYLEVTNKYSDNLYSDCKSTLINMLSPQTRPIFSI